MFTRFFGIWSILIKYDLMRFIKGRKFSWHPRFILPRLFIYLTKGLSIIFKSTETKNLSKEKSLRLALEELGPIFIKFGQVLSTRTDLIYEEMIEQLVYLQDRVKPCPPEQIIDKIEKSLQRKIPEIFSQFDRGQCTSASVAQVHYGVLKKEKAAVAIKVIKPGIKEQIERDINFLYGAARLITRVFPHTERLVLGEVVKEFEYVLEGELNMQQEGANASQLERNFSKPEDAELLKVPKIYWDYCSLDVLVMERVYGININNIDEFKRQNVDLRSLAENGVRIFFTQVFRDSFFHADMHPGNVLVDIKDPAKPIYRGVDFGIMGALSPEDKKYLALNLLAFFERDYRRVAELHVNCGWVSRDTNVEQLETAVRSVCEPIFAKPLNEIPFGAVLAQLIKVANRFNMRVQPQLLLLQKTLVNVEGLGRQLYPQLNIWETGTPILKRWLAREVGARNLAANTRRVYPELLVTIPKFVKALATGVELFNQQAQHLSAAAEEERKKTKRKMKLMRNALWISALTALGSSAALLMFLFS